MRLLKLETGKSKLLEDGSIVLVCGKGDRLIKFPLVMIAFIMVLAEVVKNWRLIEKSAWLLVSVCLVLFTLLCFRMYFEIYKMVILNNIGATIKIGRYEKFFRWNEFCVKRLEKPKTKNHLSEVLFSVNKDVHRSKWTTAAEFSASRRPFTSFSVLLDYDWDFQQRSEWESEHCRFSEPLF